MIKERLTRAVKDALAACRAEDLLPDVGVPVVIAEQHGAYMSDVPLLLARRAENTSATAGVRGGVYAEHLAERINAHDGAPAHAAVQNDGTLLLHPSEALYDATLRHVSDAGATWGRGESGAGKRVLVEFVSANPNAPITPQHARGAAIGDAVSRLLTACGYLVEREFYVNDATAASSMKSLARTVFAAYKSALTTEAEGGAPATEGMGDYYFDLAARIVASSGDRYASLSPEAAATVLAPALVSLMQDTQRETLARFGVTFDRWFSESALLAGGALQRVVDTLVASGAAYSQGGALWLRTTAFGDDGDRVLFRNDGTPSYFAGDLAYHADKLQGRAYDLAVDVWNADHQPYIGRTLAGLSALGVTPVHDRLHIAVFGPVRTVRDGAELRTSGYAPDTVTLAEILDGGADAAALRFALLAAPAASPLDVNVDVLGASAHANPLARVRAALASGGAETAAMTAPITTEPETLAESERAVIRRVDAFPELVRGAAARVAPAEIARYVLDLTEAMNHLPHHHQTNGGAGQAARITLRNALTLLGVAA